MLSSIFAYIKYHDCILHIAVSHKCFSEWHVEIPLFTLTHGTIY